jgi:hypothetical protein
LKAKDIVGRIILTALAGGAILCAVLLSVFAFHAIAASRAQDAPATPALAAAFEEAGRGWRSHMDLPVHRLVLASAEEYGTGNYVFMFDVYHWFGIGSGYVTYGPETRTCGGGGMLRNGGFAGIGEVASDDGLRESRAACADDYGPGRIVAPTGR